MKGVERRWLGATRPQVFPLQNNKIISGGLSPG